MSNLEDRTARFLKPLIEANQKTLTSSEQMLLGAWLTKTAMVSGLSADEPVRFFNPEECQLLRTEKALPSSVVDIRIGSYTGGRPRPVSQVLGVQGREPHIDVQAYFFLICVGSFVGIVYSERNLPEGTGFPALTGTMPDTGVQIRFPNGAELDWPLPTPFDDGENSLERVSQGYLSKFDLQTG